MTLAEIHPVLEAAMTEGAALCTLIAVDGGFSRAPGAQLCITANGTLVGDMTGGCLEAALLSDVNHARDTGKNKTVRYGKGSRYIDIQLPCGGGVELYVDARPDRQVIASAVHSLAKREAVSLSFSTQETGGGWRVEASGANSSSDQFTLTYHPKPRLMLFGNGPEVPALSSLAESWGAIVETFAPKGSQQAEGILTLGLVPGALAIDPFSAVILLFHDHEWEDAILDWALRSSSFYVGALGGHKAVVRRLKALRALGLEDDVLAGLRGPVGMIAAARDPQMLAISILADVAKAYGKSCGRLG
jgi:xanthine dehydrogenase accessory factor